MMQLQYEVDPRRRRLLSINVGKYVSAFPVIWLPAVRAMLPPGDAAQVGGVCWVGLLPARVCSFVPLMCSSRRVLRRGIYDWSVDLKGIEVYEETKTDP